MALGSSTKAWHKIRVYLRHGLRCLVPGIVWRYQRGALLREFANLPVEQQAAIRRRVDYYNRLDRPFIPARHAATTGEFSFAGKSTAYCIDFSRLIRWFPRDRVIDYQFGDVIDVPDSPQCLKSRPIAQPRSNQNSVLVKLNTIRHYQFVADHRRFEDKKPQAVWRGKSNRQHRIDFANRFANDPRCDIGCTLHKEKAPQPYHKDFMSIEDQLNYQFVVSVEGIDVATNLKWIMVSNSLCLMRKPRYETWFMEGALVPGIHYVELADDHSDLPDKIEYYTRHPEEAKAIIAAAQQHAAQFRDEKSERIIELLVVEKYLKLSRQLPAPIPVLQLG